VDTGVCAMIKRQFGCGGNRLVGWENYDIEVDITKPLPFPDESTDRVFAEHVVEHTDSREAFGFFKECYRILKDGGRIRICVPSIDKIHNFANEDYLNWLGQSGFGKACKRSAVENLMVNHGHKTVWSYGTLAAALYGAGFNNPTFNSARQSNDPEFNDIEGHWKVIGNHNADMESIVVEAEK